MTRPSDFSLAMSFIGLCFGALAALLLSILECLKRIEAKLHGVPNCSREPRAEATQ